jgi:hypothetical protein
VPGSTAEAESEPERRRQQQEEEDHALALALAQQFADEDSAAAPGLEPFDGSGDGDSDPFASPFGSSPLAAGPPFERQPSAGVARPSQQQPALGTSAAGAGPGGGADLLSMLSLLNSFMQEQGSEQHEQQADAAGAGTANPPRTAAAAATGGPARGDARVASSGRSGASGTALATAISTTSAGGTTRHTFSSHTSTQGHTTSTRSSGNGGGGSPAAAAGAGAGAGLLARLAASALDAYLADRAPRAGGATVSPGDPSSDLAGNWHLLHVLQQVGLQAGGSAGPGGSAPAAASEGAVPAGGLSSSSRMGAGTFGTMVGATPADQLMARILLAGARSAYEAYHSGADHQEPHSPGLGSDVAYTSSSGGGSSSSGGGGAAMGGGGGSEAGGGGLSALLSAMFGGDWDYERLAQLQDVQVTTPEEVLQQLPRSTYVAGRRPGDR